MVGIPDIFDLPALSDRWRGQTTRFPIPPNPDALANELQ
jgi:hypothetical protein